MTDHDRDKNSHPPYWRTRYAFGWLILLAISAYFLVTQHLAHFMGALPYLLLAVCPLMHLFIHHGHRPHGDHQAASQAVNDSSNVEEQTHGPR